MCTKMLSVPNRKNAKSSKTMYEKLRKVSRSLLRRSENLLKSRLIPQIKLQGTKRITIKIRNHRSHCNFRSRNVQESRKTGSGSNPYVNKQIAKSRTGIETKEPRSIKKHDPQFNTPYRTINLKGITKIEQNQGRNLVKCEILP